MLSAKLARRAMHRIDGKRGEALGHLAAAAAIDAARAARMGNGCHHPMRHLPRAPLVLARGAEQRNRRRAHRRGDVHRRGVDTDEQSRAPGEGREVAQAERADDVVDAVVRLLPGALGCERSSQDESFTTGLLDHPHFTRPAELHGVAVPDGASCAI